MLGLALSRKKDPLENTKKRTMDLSKLQKKRIWLIRHGEGQHNVFFKQGDRISGARLLGKHGATFHSVSLNQMTSLSCTDPALTEKGIEEAKSTAKHPLLPLHEAELIVSSPLKRTVQTTLLMLQTTDVATRPVVLHPDIQETGDVNCDTGQPHAHLVE